MHYETKNVKAHFNVTTPICVPERWKKNVTQHSNFWTFRPGHPVLENLVYIVFPSAGHVNVSGLKDFHDSDTVKNYFAHLFEVKALSEVSVDNSTSSGDTQEHVNLIRLYQKITTSQFLSTYPCTISIRPHYFPSALVRPKRCSRQFISTCIVFNNGKFVVVGSKSEAQTARTVNNLKQFLD